MSDDPHVITAEQLAAYRRSIAWLHGLLGIGVAGEHALALSKYCDSLSKSWQAMRDERDAAVAARDAAEAAEESLRRRSGALAALANAAVDRMEAGAPDRPRPVPYPRVGVAQCVTRE